MATLDGYTRDILIRIRSSYDALSELKDKPGDLPVINREWLGINGLLRSLADRIEASEKRSDLYTSVLKMSRRYLDSYYFEREICTMTDLYSDDPNRLKNMRLKIIESLNDRGFIGRIDDAIAELQL